MFTQHKDYQHYLKEVLIPEEKLQERIRELGAEISQDYKDKDLLKPFVLFRPFLSKLHYNGLCS